MWESFSGNSWREWEQLVLTTVGETGVGVGVVIVGTVGEIVGIA